MIRLIFFGLALALTIVVAITLFILKPKEPGFPTPSAVISAVPALSNQYADSMYHFTLSTPSDFRVTEIPSDDGQGKTVLIQNQKGEGIQIIISPFKEDLKVLTADRVRKDIPDMQISDVQTVEVGDRYKGIAFRSNNDAFEGDSREVWFVFHGNLYQISTYARLDPLLKAIFATWKFF